MKKIIFCLLRKRNDTSKKCRCSWKHWSKSKAISSHNSFTVMKSLPSFIKTILVFFRKILVLYFLQLSHSNLHGFDSSLLPSPYNSGLLWVFSPWRISCFIDYSNFWQAFGELLIAIFHGRKKIKYLNMYSSLQKLRQSLSSLWQ